MNWIITITYEDGQIEKAVCDYNLFNILQDYAQNNGYEFTFERTKPTLCPHDGKLKQLLRW